ncbi:hypothetical protein GCM10010145_38750 [Streptomyces ruber]|uniref:Lipoprotein n=2 Tax=Streptomyces TaxID=1883 RepID=A0A918ESJ9_9ACTN|nr:hypothetical protein [Streptomyces ruber]GGQ65120.1 hypothetical protein GCM10010145_38750 [Streptomyces ruber]
MTRYRLAGTAALVLLVTGCAASTEETPKTVLAAAPEPTKEVRNLLLPFDRYQLSVNEIYLIESAKDLLTRDCMRERGYDWEVIGDRKQYPDLRNRRRYGVIEMPVAREMGYKSNARLLGSTDVTARKMDREARMSPEARNAATDPEDGCYKLAGDELVRGNEENEDLVGRLNVESLEEARRSARVAPALRSWVRCMAEKGHEYKDFYAVGEDPRWVKDEVPSHAERETAEVDVTCKQQAGLVKALAETEKGIQEREIRKHKAYFERLASAKERHLADARAVIAAAD